MKKFLLLIVILFFNLNSSQIRLTDKSIVAQEKRMVYSKWGEWRPYPTYFLGIQTNFAYATVWGMWAPSRNKDYRNGQDIRPLKPTGLQMQRYSQISLMDNQTKEILTNTEAQKNAEQDEFLNKTHFTAVADPLYLVYYKPNLKSLDNFNVYSFFYIDWGFTKKKAFDEAVKFGMIEQLRSDIIELKDKYEVARGVDVSRGKRLLMYHDVFLQWRKLKQRIRDTENTFYLTELTKSKLMQYRIDTATHHTRSDSEIFNEVLKNAKLN